MAFKHIKYNSLVLAETIYSHVKDQPFAIQELRKKGVISMDARVGSAMDDLRNAHYIESVEGFRRSHYSKVTKRWMYWRFTPSFAMKRPVIQKFVAELSTS